MLLPMVFNVSITTTLRFQTVLSLFLNCSYPCYKVKKRTRVAYVTLLRELKRRDSQNFVIGIYLGSFQILDWITF